MTEQTTKKESFLSNPVAQSGIGIVVILLALGGFIFWQQSYGTISIENSDIEAPMINLSSDTAGTLNALYVKEGDTVQANVPVALVGTNIVASKQDGIVTFTSDNIGTYFPPGGTVVSMIHPEDMKVVGALDETKGLDEIKPGQKATFTVDAFSGKTYVGTVDSVGETADDSGVVFSISDKRPVKQFDVKVAFDVTKYPELKNGMSAKITVYTK
jgi:multidrug resistance efflux pump